MIQLTKSLAIEWAKRGVRVNSISPGYIGTELTLNSPTLVPLIEKWNEMAPLGRMGRPEELQSICVYLAGDTGKLDNKKGIQCGFSKKMYCIPFSVFLIRSSRRFSVFSYMIPVSRKWWAESMGA